MFAVVCGTPGPNGLFFMAIDVDDPTFDLKLLRTTQTERTPRKGLHFIYWSEINAKGKKYPKIKLELLGIGNLCIMYPSEGYLRLNDNFPTVVEDVSQIFQDLAKKLGVAEQTWESAPVPVQAVRFCCREALARDHHIEHLMRLAIASEYKRAGYSDEQVVDLFKTQDDFDREKCLVQVKSADATIRTKKETIKDYGYCYEDCQEKCDSAHVYIAKLREQVDKINRELKAKNIFELWLKDIDKKVKYDLQAKSAVFLTCISACTPKNAINLYLTGPSSVGKSYNATEVAKYFPKADIWFIGGLSRTAIVHDFAKLLDRNGEEIKEGDRPLRPVRKNYQNKDEFADAEKQYKTLLTAYKHRLEGSYYFIDMSHKILLFLETPNEETIRTLFPILSHDTERIEFRFTDRSGRGSLQTKNVVVSGFPSCIFCSVDRRYIEEMSTRCLTAPVEENEIKFEAANKLTNLKASYPEEFEEETEEFNHIKELIENIWALCKNENVDVSIPLDDLCSFFPKEMPRDQRDFQHFTFFIKALALLHIFSRPCKVDKNKHRFVVAAGQDVIDGFGLYAKIFEVTRTGANARVLDFYWKLVATRKEKPWYVAELVTEYNKLNLRKKAVSDYTIRAWLERLNQLEYVDKDIDPTNKNRNIYTALVKEEERENTLKTETHVDFSAILKKNLNTWLARSKKNRCSFYENYFSDKPITDEAIERLVTPEKNISILDDPFFAYPSKPETVPKDEKKLETTLKTETNVNSHGSDNLTPYFIRCYFCGQPIGDEENRVSGELTENKPAHKSCFDEHMREGEK
jgi:hypothetical protein